MTTIDATPLTETLQSLVDARLDTIDRMLLGRVNRQDRLAIVREVESQIFDLLQGREGGSLDRDDVLAVLARLDPPEAYLPDDDSTAEARPTRISATPRAISAPGGAQSGRIGLASGILGMVSLAILVLGLSIGISLQSIFVYMGSIALALTTSLLAIIFSAKARLRNAWAIVGLVTGILSILLSVVGGLLS